MALYDEHNTGSDINLNIPAGVVIQKRAQAFNAQYSYACQNFRLKLSRVGSPGTITVRLYDTVAFPTAENLQGTATYDGDTITTSYFGEWVVFDFGAPVTITAGTQYWLLVETPSAGDATNYIRWRVDTDNGYTHGTLYYYWPTAWSFNAAYDAMFEMHDAYASAPSKATVPVPANAGTGVSKELAALSWTLGANASTENVYFGPTGSVVLVDTLNNTETFALSDYLPLDLNTEYSWRIDSVNAVGTTTGDTWSFTTLVLAPPNPSVYQVIKRLCATARRTFWYEDI